LVDNFAGVTEIGIVTIDFTDVDMSRFKKRNAIYSGVHVTEYKLEYQIELNFRAESGVLGITCISGGKRIGTTTIEFQE